MVCNAAALFLYFFYYKRHPSILILVYVLIPGSGGGKFTIHLYHCWQPDVSDRPLALVYICICMQGWMDIYWLYMLKQYTVFLSYLLLVTSASFHLPPTPFRKTRTCIHTPGYPPMTPEELTKENLFAALNGVDMVYFDVRLHETALLVAEEVIFSCLNITFIL